MNDESRRTKDEGSPNDQSPTESAISQSPRASCLACGGSAARRPRWQDRRKRSARPSVPGWGGKCASGDRWNWCARFQRKGIPRRPAGRRPELCASCPDPILPAQRCWKLRWGSGEGQQGWAWARPRWRPTLKPRDRRPTTVPSRQRSTLWLEVDGVISTGSRRRRILLEIDSWGAESRRDGVGNSTLPVQDLPWNCVNRMKVLLQFGEFLTEAIAARAHPLAA